MLSGRHHGDSKQAASAATAPAVATAAPVASSRRSPFAGVGRKRRRKRGRKREKSEDRETKCLEQCHNLPACAIRRQNERLTTWAIWVIRMIRVVEAGRIQKGQLLAKTCL
jgi:hypothetical protein